MKIGRTSKESEVRKLILTTEKSLMQFTSLFYSLISACWGAHLNWTSCILRLTGKIL